MKISETVMTFMVGQRNNIQSIQDLGILIIITDADLASRALDLFKKDLGIEPTKTKSSSKQTRKSAADMVSTKTTSVEPNQQKGMV